MTATAEGRSMTKHPRADNLRVVPMGAGTSELGVTSGPVTSSAASYVWPTHARCRDCRYQIDLAVLADTIEVDTRARAVRSVDDYLESIGWQARHGGNDLCPTCRAAADEQVRKQLDALTAPGAHVAGGQPGAAAIGDELDKMTAQPSAFAALDDDNDSGEPSGDPVRDELSKLTSPWQCRICDNENPPKTQTCKRCGTPRPPADKDEVDDEVDEDVWTCPVCGAAVDQDTDTCPLCGNERDTTK